MSECHLLADPPKAASALLLHLLLIEEAAVDLEFVTVALGQAGIGCVYDRVNSLESARQCLQSRQYSALLYSPDLSINRFSEDRTEDWFQIGQDIPRIFIVEAISETAIAAWLHAGMTDYILRDQMEQLPLVVMRSLRDFDLRRQQRLMELRLQQQVQREQCLDRIVDALREPLTLHDVIQTTVAQVQEALQVSQCDLLLTEAVPEEGASYPVNHAVLDSDSPLAGISTFAIHAHFHELLAQRYCVILPAIDPDLALTLPPSVQEEVKTHALRAVLMAPLIHQGTYLGALILRQCDHDRQWSEDEITLVKAIAAQCVSAIHQAQLRQQMERQAQYQHLLSTIRHVLNANLDADLILQDITRLTGEYFQVDRVTLFVIDAERLKRLHEWRANTQLTSEQHCAISWVPLAEGLTPQALLGLQQLCYPVKVRCAGTLPEPPIYWYQPDLVSLLQAPIVIRGHLFGGISLATTTVRNFTDEDSERLQSIAELTAIALSSAQSNDYLETLVQERTHELEQQKALFEATNKSKSEFLAHMSHELRTPLTGILGFSSILLKDVFGTLNAKQQQYVEGIASCGKHLLDLINDLLDLSKIEAGKEELFLEMVVVQEICEACLHMIHELANQRGLSTHLSIAPDVTVCTADKRRLRQILFNLLSNAVKFTDVGSVHLEVYQCDRTLYFAVKDTGIGISAADIGKLFQSFQQLDSGLNRKYEGTGLGLVLAQKLAQLHGGKITVTSQLKQGSCFTLQLPLPQEEEGDHKSHYEAQTMPHKTNVGCCQVKDHLDANHQ